MVVTQDKIENLLYSLPENLKLVDFLSLQEMDIIETIFYQALTKEEGALSSGKDMAASQEKVAAAVVKELKDAEIFFGIKDFAGKFDTKAFVKAFYENYFQQ